MRILLVSDLRTTHCASSTGWWRVGPRIRPRDPRRGHPLIRSAVPLEAQSVTALQYLSLLQSVTRVAVSSGNHDLTGPDAQGEQTALWLDEARASGIPTDGDSLMMGDALVTLCPWWDGPAGRARVVEQLAADAARAAAFHVWIYHWPPTGSPTSWTGRREYGDADLAGWIRAYQPDLVLTGHVHESPFKPEGAWADRVGHTWVFNSGHQIGPVPAHIVLDLDAKRARWVSLLGTEEIELHRDRGPGPHRLLNPWAGGASVLGVGLPGRTAPCGSVLPLGQPGEDSVDHGESRRVAVLVLQVGQVGRHVVEALGQAHRDEAGELGVAAQHAPPSLA